jgi:hypothetical protein
MDWTLLPEDGSTLRAQQWAFGFRPAERLCCVIASLSGSDIDLYIVIMTSLDSIISVSWAPGSPYQQISLNAKDVSSVRLPA